MFRILLKRGREYTKREGKKNKTTKQEHLKKYRQTKDQCKARKKENQNL